jgi:methionyl-tRNA formyltransferase
MNAITNFENKKIVMLCNHGDSSRIVYHRLSQHFDITKVVMEDSVSKKKMIQRRIKKLGIVTVFGQLIFQVGICKFLKKSGRARIAEIKQEYDLNTSEMPADSVVEVNSVNSDNTYQLLQSINPDIVVVNGTRIISKRILECCDAIFINTHSGITPRYRGTHGGYWALVEGNLKNCGVTVHLVDPGIDTGEILGQATFEPVASSNFTTYPYMQLAKGLPVLVKAVDDALQDNLHPHKRDDLSSQLWYHPTAWRYLWNRWFGNRVK